MERLGLGDTIDTADTIDTPSISMVQLSKYRLSLAITLSFVFCWH